MDGLSEEMRLKLQLKDDEVDMEKQVGILKQAIFSFKKLFFFS